MNRLILAFVLGASVVSAQDAQLASKAVAVLEQRCWGCHSATLSQSGLRLDSRESILHGGNRGAAIIAGNASQSRLIQQFEGRATSPCPPARNSRIPRSR